MECSGTATSIAQYLIVVTPVGEDGEKSPQVLLPRSPLHLYSFYSGEEIVARGARELILAWLVGRFNFLTQTWLISWSVVEAVSY